jgi:acetoin utilization deacetylase AcuC-like enzyme
MPGYGRGYPEVPARIDRIRTAVEAAGLGPLTPPGDFGMEPVEAVHAPGLLAHLRTGFEASRGDTPGDDPYIPHTFAVRARRPNAADGPGAFGAWAFDTGCPIYRGTWDAVYQATQAALTAAEHVQAGGRTAYAMIRPPGHHAGPDFHGGFCYLNHAAIAARFLQRASGGRVAVLDIDYHHGNGTQEVFYRDPDVLYVSLHADPRFDYPFYWGFADERGDGPGEGTNLNLPLPPATGDRDYLTALGTALAEVERFAPGHIVLSAGFDLMAGDPVPRGGFRITGDGLRQIGEQIAGLGLPTVIVQEGGYNLEMLGEYAVTLLRPFAA